MQSLTENFKTFRSIGLIYNLNMSVEGAFWPLKWKVSHIQFDPKKMDASLLKLTKIANFCPHLTLHYRWPAPRVIWCTDFEGVTRERSRFRCWNLVFLNVDKILSWLGVFCGHLILILNILNPLFPKK